MLEKLLLSLLFFIVASPAIAVSWPPEVKPEQGKAWNKREVHDTYDGRVLGESYREMTFWNVGQVSGNSEYAKVILSADCSKSTTPGCIAGDPMEGIFSGGPNGVITISGYEFKLHDGQYFELNSGGTTTKYTVENPEIFSKYRWSMDEAPPIPKISGDKYSIETIGAARFNDLYGQVEVNIPKPDGTYDDEKWDFAKIDMELPPGTKIKVGEKSGLLLTFPNTQTDIIVGPETDIVLVDVAQEKMSMEGSPWGKLKASVKKLLKDGSLEIEMSQAVAGIKGTIFSLEDTRDKSTIKVTEGSVAFTSKATGQTQMVNAGETLSADTNGLGQKATFDPVAEEKQWKELKDSLKKTNANLLGNKKMMYILGGILVTAIAIGFLAIKVKRHKK